MTDVAFDPTAAGFKWTNDDSCGGMGWYEYDKSAEKTARKDRDDFARKQRKLGKTVKCSTNRSLRSFGGIGSGRPHIELIVPIFRALVIEGV
ncbi:MAG: hypothetical protein ACYS7Y_35210 [Planctomycetota bacterium]|jgi:hypothetical protein